MDLERTIAVPSGLRLGRRNVFRLLAIASALSASTFAGCAPRRSTSLSAPPRGPRATTADWQSPVAIKASGGPVETDLQAGVIGRGRGAGTGAAGGAVAGIDAAAGIMQGAGSGTGAAAGASLLIALPLAGLVFLTSVVAGTVAGAVSALPTEEAERIEAVIRRTLLRPDMAEDLERVALAYAANQLGPAVVETATHESPVATLLDIQLEVVGFVSASPGRDPDLVLAARGGYRRVATAGQLEQVSRSGLSVTYGPNKLSAWTAAEGVLLDKGVTAVITELAHRIVDEALLEVRFTYPI